MKCFIILLTLVLMVAPTLASVPPIINYQGKLMQPSGTAVADGIYSIQFAIYDVPTGGTAIWSETNPSVQVKGGLFATMMGSVVNLPTNVFDNPNRFLGIKVGSDAEMTPRQQIASVAFAMKADEADSSKTVPDGAITTSKIADNSIISPKLAEGSVTGAKITPQAVTTDKLADLAVSTAKIADGAVVGSKLQATESWIEPSFSTDWSNYDLVGTTWGHVSYYKDITGTVHLRGMAQHNIAEASVMFILPEGYRPSWRSLFIVESSPGGFRRVDVLKTGQVWVDAPNCDWVSLDGITFRGGL